MSTTTIDERVDETKFRIVEPKNIDGEINTPLSPFKRGELYESDRFLRCFLASSAPPTAPASPTIAETPPNFPSTPTSPDIVTILEFHSPSADSHHDGHFDESDHTPVNTRSFNTPSMSKRTTRERVSLENNCDPELIPPSSMIVPILIPDKHGTLVSDETKTNNESFPMATHFAILVSNYKDVFSPKPKATTLLERNATTNTIPSLQRRRSVTFLNVNPSNDEHYPRYLLVERNENTRTRSAQLPDVQVRLLVSLNDLKKRMFRMHGQAFDAILKESMNRMTRPPQRYQGELLDIYLQQTFIPCQTLTMLCKQCVLEPLCAKDGTIITVSGANNILDNMYVQGWPDSKEPTVGWYSDDRITDRRIMREL